MLIKFLAVNLFLNAIVSWFLIVRISDVFRRHENLRTPYKIGIIVSIIPGVFFWVIGLLLIHRLGGEDVYKFLKEKEENDEGNIS